MSGGSFKAIALVAPIFMLLAAGCETGGALTDAKRPADAVTHITRVAYLTGEKGTVVKVYGSGRFEHTSYKLSDPLRIAVEIPNVVLDFEPKRVRLHDSSVAHLNVVRFAKVNSVRLELELLTDVPYNITQKKRFLEIIIANAPERTFPPGSVRPGVGSAGGEEKEELEKLRQENIDNRMAMIELEKENSSLKQRLEEARQQMEEAGSMNKALQTRIEFMEGKLSDIQEKMAISLPGPSISGPTGDMPGGMDSLQARVEIEEMINGWLETWNRKEIKAFSAYYSEDFETGTMNRRQWLRDKRMKFARPGEIEITVENLRITFDIEGVIAAFEQTFRSPVYRDRGLKIISLTKEDGNWKIRSETWTPL
jgi:hypothetical protein